MHIISQRRNPACLSMLKGLMLNLSAKQMKSDKVEKDVSFVKALLTARGILLEEAHNLSRAIDQSIDLNNFISQLKDSKIFGSLIPPDVSSTETDNQRPESAEFRSSNEGTSGVMECSCPYLRTVYFGMHI